ncbi:MAG: iron chelate uptake ABC transporter family permease subunit [Paraglaciecola sp.]|uniref:FecCD family ABC transporter permease n=1 Tax=Paraglaciecola sp. TaxID=1920173 RepID=UPI003298A222
MDKVTVLRSGRYSVRFDYRHAWFNLGLIVLILIAGGHALVSGSKLLDFSDVIRFVLGEGLTPLQHKILIDIRLPVVLTALAVGASLGASGAVFQSVSRNLLGSPDVLGFTSGAALGAVYHLIAIGQQPLGVALFAFLGGCVTAAIIYFGALKTGTLNTSRLILVGIGVGATLTAITSFLLVKGDLDNSMQATMWLAGSLDGKNWDHVLTAMGGSILGVPILMCLAKPLNLAEMGDALALGLGVNIALSRHLSLLVAVLMVALATAAAGPIAFIALGAPHLARLFVGSTLPIVTSALTGAALLILAHRVSSVFTIAENLPIGRITAILGGVYLIVLLVNQNRKKQL